MKNNNIQLLECTSRDGALCLEDAWIKQLSKAQFTPQASKKLNQIIAKIHSEIVEIGSIELSSKDKQCFNIYQNIEEASRAIPNNRYNDQIYCAMFRGPDTPLHDIPERRNVLIDGIRVILRYSQLKKSLDFCANLAMKGFKVFIQPMVTMRYKDSELQMCIDFANDMNAYALYFVDSYGYMMSNDVIRLVGIYNKELKRQIRIGFHAHNNINMAFANTITFLNYCINRDIIIDATANGMGQGAGNLQTELIADYLNNNYGKHYNYSAVLDACDFIEKYNKDRIWGYSVARVIPAIHKCAYKYSITFRHKYGLNYSQINKIFENMPPEYQYRYTDEYAKKILVLNGFAD